MILLFEHAAKRGGGEMPVDLITRDVRGVSLLEFLAHSEVAADEQEMTVEAAAEGEASERARQTRAMIQAAREEAAAEARRECEAELEGVLRQERERVDRICVEFARDRERYFAAAETQVVKLAMATARKVLAREVAADAMHLTATVRAALTRVREGSATILRVPAQDAESWRSLFAGAAVEVREDEGLDAGECLLETNVGRVEMGVEVQMREIERGFGELMQRHAE